MADVSMVTHAIGMNSNLGEIVKALAVAFPLHSSTGAFTMGASASQTVTDAAVKTSSVVLLMPTNPAAAMLLNSSHNLYVSARVQGTSFTVTTADGGAAVGTETFGYLIVSTG
jgi:hypothetical protein